MKQNHKFFNKIQDLRKAGEIVGFVDEVGRGPLFGEVVAVCVVLPDGFYYRKVDDSKVISETERRNIALVIKAHALDYGIGISTVKEIERMNILEATKLAWKRSVLDMLEIRPTIIFIDGPFIIPEIKIQQYPVVGGDKKIFGIACASIIAKDYRDTFMIKYYSKKFPEYDLEHNKGYSTPGHIQAIKRFGLTPFHRSFFCRKLLAAGQK